MRRYKQPFAKNVLWAFVVFFGFTFSISNESEEADIVRYVEQMQGMHQENFTVSKAIEYYVNSGEVDVLRIFLAITVSRFTDSQAILTAVYALIFGFFFSRNMFFVLDRLDGKLKYATVFLFLCFVLIVPIWNINGFRMYTAMHMFFYGLLPYLFSREKSKLWLCGASVFVHYSFLFPVVVLLLYMVAGNRLWIYFFFFAATIFISEINIERFNQLFEAYLPEQFVEQSEGYRLVEKIEEYKKGSDTKVVWYARWYAKALKYALFGLLILFFFKARNKIYQYKGLLNLFSFTLLFYGFANILSTFPAGGRFMSLAALCALALLIIYIQNIDWQYNFKKWVVATSPLLLLYIIVSARIGLYSFSVLTVFGNPFLAVAAFGESIALNDIMKWIYGG